MLSGRRKVFVRRIVVERRTVKRRSVGHRCGSSRKRYTSSSPEWKGLGARIDEALHEAEELASATAAAGSDGALQALLKLPEVADAMAAIANDPANLASYSPEDPRHAKIFEALNLLNMHAQGAEA